jgi:hypothetical protein
MRGELTTGAESPMRAYCERVSVSILSVARKVGVSYWTAWCWHAGRNVPSLVHAFKLEQATGGGVPAVSWLATPAAQLEWNREVDHSRFKRQKKASRKAHMDRVRAAKTGSA